MTDKTIAIIGLGYVGLPLAVEFGKKYQVIGFDIQSSRIEELTTGFDRTRECSAQQLAESKFLRYTANLEELGSAQIFIVTVPTPVDTANRPDFSPLVSASETVGRVISSGALVIYESTVYPGATEEVCVPVLERVSGLRFNKDFFCGYSPERINPGDKTNTLTKIRKITSGSNATVANEVDALYASIIEAGTWKASSIKVAEAAKVIENTQRDLNIAFVNELSLICERLGIDTMDVLDAAGTKWNFLPFKPGMVGGHCIGVDPYYLTHKAEQLGYHPQVILAGRRINDGMARYAGQTFVKRMVRAGIDISKATVGVLGITFKENCPDIRNSKIVDMIRELEGWGINVRVSDPWADPDEVMHEYGLQLSAFGSDSAFDAIVVAIGHNQFRAMTPQALRELCRVDGSQPLIGDLKSLYSRDQLTEYGFDVFRL
jgi:UDP-N-acetyl-D-glucosamine/UDP-N-acetyl-D-galactosamine dehydrogenase